MGKRKHKRSNSEIRRKIRRLEANLNKNKRHHRYRRREKKERRDDTSSFSSDSNDYSYSENEEYHSEDTEKELYYDVDDDVEQSPSRVPHESASTPGAASSVPEISTEAISGPQGPNTSDSNQPSQSEVPQEIINLLGEAKKLEQPLGEKVPTEISERWGKILLDGLEKEQKEALTERMLIPENFTLARAPKLNAEVAAVLSESARNRDKRLEKSQNQLGFGLAGLVNLTKDLIHSDVEKLDIIKRLSEISQILLDLHYEETVNRRKLIVPLLDKKFWSTIQGVKRDSFLFGDKLSENIKNTKDIEKSSQHIKKPTYYQQLQRKNTTPAGNARTFPRQQNAAKTAQTRYQNPPPPPAAPRKYTKPRSRAAHSGRSHDRRHK